MAPTFTQPPALSRQDMDKIIAQAFGDRPSDVFGNFNTAYERLNQGPDLLSKANEENPRIQAYTATHNFGRAFINEYYKRTGKMPDAQMVKEFVGSALDPSTAQGFIKGTFSEGNQAESARGYIDDLLSQAQAGAPGATDPLVDDQKASIAEMIGAARDQGLKDIDTAFATERGRAIDEAGAMSRQPGFRNNLNVIDTNKANSISSLINSLRGKQAELGVSGAQFGANLGLQKEGLGLQRKSMTESIKNAREDRSLNQYNSEEERRLADRAGREAASASKPGWMDYTKLALGGLGALGSLGQGYGAAFKK